MIDYEIDKTAFIMHCCSLILTVVALQLLDNSFIMTKFEKSQTYKMKKTQQIMHNLSLSKTKKKINEINTISCKM